jgi:uncharacterized protein (TIGR03437 family)
MTRAAFLLLVPLISNAQTQPAPAQRVITTFAGTDFVFPRQPLPGLRAPIGQIAGMASDSSGNLYISDLSNSVVVKMDRAGIVSVFAGNGTVGFSGEGGPATSAALSLGSKLPVFSGVLGASFYGIPSMSGGIATDAEGNVFIADSGNHRVRKVSPAGVITTIAGSGQRGFSGDGAAATLASLNSPTAVAVDRAGNVFISDTLNHRVRKVSPAGIITTFVGSGNSLQDPVSGPATQSSVPNPAGIAADAAGNLYIASRNAAPLLIKVSPSGVLSLIQLPASSLCQARRADAGLAFDGSGNLYMASAYCGAVYKMTPDGAIVTRNGDIAVVAGAGQTAVVGFSGDGGTAAAALLNRPTALAADAAGNLFIADTMNLRVRAVTPEGIINTVAGNGEWRYGGDGAPAASAYLSSPNGVAVDSAGVLIADTRNNRIRRVTPDGRISTLAGTGNYSFSGDGGAAIAAALAKPTKVATGVSGDVLISDDGNGRIRRVDPAGAISTLAFGSGGVAEDAKGNVFLVQGNSILKKVPPIGTSSTVGTFSTGVSDIASDAVGNLLLAISTQATVQQLTNGGATRAIAGLGAQCFSGDGGVATAATLYMPSGVATDAAGSVYIADTGNHRVRMVTPDGIINTLAGSGVAACGEGGLGYDALAGLITSGNPGFSGDGGLAPAAMLNNPLGAAVDASGNVFIADTGNNRIRVVLAKPPAAQISATILQFTGQSSGAPAPTQSFSISSVPGLAFSLSVSTASGGNWLSVTPASGAAPRLINVVANPSNLPSPGTYTGTIEIATPNANPPTSTIAVSFTVTAAEAPSLAVDRESFSLSFARATPAQSQKLTVSNTGGGRLDFNAAAAVTTPSGGTWLTVTPASGTAAAAAPAIVTVAANPAGLPPGTYTGIVTVSASGKQISLPVTMTISSLDQAILLSQQGLSFTAVAKGGVVPAQTFAVRNIGTGTVNWTTSTATLPSGLGWLQVSPAIGTSDAAQSPPSVTVSVKPDGLVPGSYYGTVQVDAPRAANSPQVLTVFLKVLPAGTDAGAVVGPGSLVFATAPGGGSPGSQNLAIYNITADPKSFRTSVAADAGVTLVTVPSDATLDPQQPMHVVVQPFVDSAGPGVYNGTVTLQFNDGGVSRVNVKVIVTSGARMSAAVFTEKQGRGLRSLPADVCTPKKLVPALTTIPDSFELSVGWPAALAAQVNDDCGVPLQSGSVTATFSNGDAPVQLQLQQNGRWEGTWATHGSQSHVTIRLHAEASQSQITGDQQVTGSLLDQQQPPVFNAGGIVGVFGGPKFTALAPGSVISIYGDRLAESTVAAPGFPLQTSLAGTGAKVVIQGRAMPLYYVSQNQINAVVPFGVNINAPQQIVIQRGTTLSLPIQVNLAAAEPAIFGGDGAITVYPANGGVPYAVTSANPAHSGDTVVLYAVGLGAVSPAVTDGGLPEHMSQATAAAAQLLIGGAAAHVSFIGLTSQFPGLYQINAVVPDVAPDSAVPVTLRIGGQISPQIAVPIQR